MERTPTFDEAKSDPWFWICVEEAMDTEGFIANWRRLHGYPVAGHPIEAMVDEATGAEKARAQEFIRDIYDIVYTRIPRPEIA